MTGDMILGATPTEEGCHFAVWAPHADAVYVIGSFNDWDNSANPLDAGEDGIWRGDVKGAQVGDEYRFRIVNGDEEYSRIDPYARRVTNSVGNGIITKLDHVAPSERFTPPPHNQLIIYELHIGTFGKMDDDDGPGNLEGAIKGLSYLSELGINAVEIMPLVEFPGGYSWGYNPAHIFAVESHYGTPHTFWQFVQEAHRLGIAVIVDVVYNHLGPNDLDLWQFDGWSENGGGGIYFYNDERAETPWGATRPDYGRDEVRRYIHDNAMMWFEEYDVDGLRWDATAYIRNIKGQNDDPDHDLPDGWSLMQWVNRDTVSVKSNIILIAEDLQSNPYLTKRPDDDGAGFHTQWDARFVHPIREALITAEDASRDMEAVRSALEHRFHLDAFERVIYTESHDEVANGKARVPEEVDPGHASSWAAKKKSALGAALVFTAPGIPMIFQGQEFLEDDWFHDQDPIDWRKREAFAGILKLYTDLIALRLNKDGKTKGLSGQEIHVHHVNNEANMIAYYRWEIDETDYVVVVANFSSEPREGYVVGFPDTGEWTVLFNSDSTDYDPEFGDYGQQNVTAEEGETDGLSAFGAIDVAPYSALVLARATIG